MYVYFALYGLKFRLYTTFKLYWYNKSINIKKPYKQNKRK